MIFLVTYVLQEKFNCHLTFLCDVLFTKSIWLSISKVNHGVFKFFSNRLYKHMNSLFSLWSLTNWSEYCLISLNFLISVSMIICNFLLLALFVLGFFSMFFFKLLNMKTLFSSRFTCGYAILGRYVIN